MDPLSLLVRLPRYLAMLSSPTRRVVLVFFGLALTMGAVWWVLWLLTQDPGVEVQTPTGTLHVRDESPFESNWGVLIVPVLAGVLTAVWYLRWGRGGSATKGRAVVNGIAGIRGSAPRKK